MSTEPASLIPLMKGVRIFLLYFQADLSLNVQKSQHLALIGDHKQLPPIIQSREAQRGGLDISLFERLIKEGGAYLFTIYVFH